jgi:hypothetical protein
MHVSASWTGAWWIVVFVGALVLVAHVPPRRRAPEVTPEDDRRPAFQREESR